MKPRGETPVGWGGGKRLAVLSQEAAGRKRHLLEVPRPVIEVKSVRFSRFESQHPIPLANEDVVLAELRSDGVATFDFPYHPIKRQFLDRIHVPHGFRFVVRHIQI